MRTVSIWMSHERHTETVNKPTTAPTLISQFANLDLQLTGMPSLIELVYFSFKNKNLKKSLIVKSSQVNVTQLDLCSDTNKHLPRTTLTVSTFRTGLMRLQRFTLDFKLSLSITSLCTYPSQKLEKFMAELKWKQLALCSSWRLCLLPALIFPVYLIMPSCHLMVPSLILLSMCYAVPIRTCVYKYPCIH